VAIVGYGPTLLQTWERLKDWPGPIWTVSKAHDFLIERGIVPTFHTDIDMREHKADFIKTPHPDVEYIIATQVHPRYLDNLKGMRVFLWQSAVYPKLPMDRRYPRMTARVDCGLQAAELALHYGYAEQHWFGIDSGLQHRQTHAGPHEGVHSHPVPIKFGPEVFETTQLFIHSLLLGEKMLQERVKMRVTVHGKGLLARFLAERGRTRVKFAP